MSSKPEAIQPDAPTQSDDLDQRIAAAYDDLSVIPPLAWALLREGARDRRSPFHTPALASLGRDGAPKLRTLVLREARPETGIIRLNSDLRSEKIAELRAAPRAALQVYDAGRKIQLRLDVSAQVQHDGPEAEAAWRAAHVGSRLTYRGTPGPGAPLARPEDLDHGPGSEDLEAGREVFCVLLLSVLRMDWLYLAGRGNRRARFDLETGAAGWLSP